MRNFRDLKIWQQAMELVKSVYALKDKLPKSEEFGLKSQITRAAVSIPSNIAEGCSRNSDKDLARFLEIAIGSSFELETQMILIHELYPDTNTNEIISKLNELEKMLNAFIKSLRSLPNPQHLTPKS